MKATFVKFVNKKQVLFKLDTPLEYEDYAASGHRMKRTKYVISSVASVLGELETYLFAANSKGDVTCWAELNGIKGIANHLELFKQTGIKVAIPKAIEVLF